ncbi:ribosomal lysine N-methyltransferase Ecym_5583 [Eremothecium cymbalariae DBVPG|uniref:Ribosomal lysine N-methyltransferase 4 n=1 Tax=Eremothecium cymbalariae (strain CBS 270.75 / DBVPG 7215 / KCTC 17166 / NRRL Y-17582) TaxID=931890 RepID=I6NE29_ERECY|nr:hypothetical protein Ecym_5583 [Eremothecium cymbalariae DBVPG\
MVETFNDVSEGFMRWLVESGVEISPKVKLVDFREQGQNRCLIAGDKICKDETLFTLPTSLLLNVENSALVQKSESIRLSLLTEIGHWEGLIICLFYESHVLKEKSKWWPYLRVFPDPSHMDNLMYWEDEELAKLKPSLVLSRVGKDSAREMYHRTLDYVSEWGVDELTKMSWDSFVHVASIIMAYSFDYRLPKDTDDDDEEDESDDEIEEGGTVESDGLIKSMVALADMLNSDTNLVNANLIYADDVLKMVAVKDIEPHEQIYNIYGEYPNAEILRRYGYVEWTGSKYDYAEIEQETIIKKVSDHLDVTTSFLQGVVEILSSHDNWIEELFDFEDVMLEIYDCYVDGTVTPQSVFLLQLLCTIAQIPGIMELSKDSLNVQVRKMSKKILQLLEGGRITKNTARIWEHIIDSKLKNYPTSAFLDYPVNGTNLSDDVSMRRKRMAECVLRCEVRSFQNCVKALERSYKIIEDEKLLKNVLKRKIEDLEQKTVKKVKRDTLQQ